MVEDDRIVDLAFELAATPEILLDARGVVVAVNARARELFGLGADAVGHPFEDLEVSYRPVDLRPVIDQLRAEHGVVELGEVSRWSPSGDLTYLDIKLVPLLVDGRHVGVTITFVDVTRHRQLRQELGQAHGELERAYGEVRSANEELETTNEELQSTNEELATTNEELQSTNEELERTNKELSSTNEELRVINDELRDRAVEVNEVNAYIEPVLSTLEASVIVVDRHLQIRVWNGFSFEMWGLRAEEVEGHDFLGLDVGFPVDSLAPLIRACIQGGDPGPPVTVEAVSRRGHPMVCSAKVAPLRGPERKVAGAIVLISEEKDAR